MNKPVDAAEHPPEVLTIGAWAKRVSFPVSALRHCRDLGFSIEETRELVAESSSPGRDCVEARSIAQVHLTAVRANMAELRRLEQSLTRYVRACHQGCAGGPAPNCSILTDLRQGMHAAPAAAGCCS